MIRLQDIADMAGVSRTTVSNVINGNTKRVSQKTIDKINGNPERTELCSAYGFRYAVRTWFQDHRRGTWFCPGSWNVLPAGLLCRRLVGTIQMEAEMKDTMSC